MSVQIEIVDDPARACAALLVGACADAGRVVLAGGSTPKAAYEELVKTVHAVGLDLTQTRFWFGDERCVGPQDERSNYGMVRDSLLEPLGRENQPIVERMQGELGPQEGARAYEEKVVGLRFDLLLLGIGPDGHTLSLFPDQPSLQERSRLVLGVPQAGLEPFVPRISFTFPALELADRVVVLASGESKADAVASAFGPDARPTPHVPSSMVREFASELTVLIDPAASARL